MTKILIYEDGTGFPLTKMEDAHVIIKKFQSFFLVEKLNVKHKFNTDQLDFGQQVPFTLKIDLFDGFLRVLKSKLEKFKTDADFKIETLKCESQPFSAMKHLEAAYKKAVLGEVDAKNRCFTKTQLDNIKLLEDAAWNGWEQSKYTGGNPKFLEILLDCSKLRSGIDSIG